jgi:cytochrome P450
VLTRHAFVVAVLRDPRMSVDRPFQPKPTGDDLLSAMLAAQEQDEHLSDDEILRFDSPVQATSRVPVETVELFGARFEKGREIALLLGASNHDLSVFADPGRLDLGRPDNRHVSFGFGIHFCLGAGLARLEGELALAASDDTLEWRPGWLLRGLPSLPVTV